MWCQKFDCKRNSSWSGFGLTKLGGLAFFALVAKLVKKWSHGFWEILLGSIKNVCKMRCENFGSKRNLSWLGFRLAAVPAGWLGYVFVRNLSRQLGRPSLWQSVNTCKEGEMGALAAVCTPTLKSASKKHQNSTPPYRSTVDGTLKVVKGTVYCVSFSRSGNQSFSSPFSVTFRLEQATRVCSGENLPKVRTPFPTSQVPFKRL